MTLARRPALLLCILAACLPGLTVVEVDAQQGQGQIEITLADTTEEPLAPLPDDESPAEAEGPEPEDSSPGDGVTTGDNTLAADCREVQYPCTRMYSVHRPVKQCISQVCVSSVKRVYMVNNEICSRTMCKEDEIMEEERCRQRMGLPPRRSARSNYPCKRGHYGVREHGVF